MQGTRFSFEIQPVLPKTLRGLEELANDLFYSWNRGVRRLFWRLDPALWERCGHNPKVFLRQVAQRKLDEAARDRIYREEYNRILSVYNTYHRESTRSEIEQTLNPQEDLVAYFCAEFGFHESFPIYSGGLGILAGDHCKAASDLGLPFVAVGLLYRQGYFIQAIDAMGNQLSFYPSAHFQDLPITPALNAKGEPVVVTIDFPGRTLSLKVWVAKAGHIRLYLLDSDIPENSARDREILHRLYGGDRTTRIEQEMALGIGGVRALRALGLNPIVWHINEGHAAFLILERCRELTTASEGLDFAQALEAVAAGTVFTTHTPVSAGHDIFDHNLIEGYFVPYLNELNTDRDTFFALGASPAGPNTFNMTALAFRGSRFHNGVSCIHGEVASHMESYIWPEIPPQENPIGYVTNGVHLPTFLAQEWQNLFEMRLSEWRGELLNDHYWAHIDDIPDHRFWSLRQELKSAMIKDVRRRLRRQMHRNGYSDMQINQVTQHLSSEHPDVLVLGFARRFATYKRAGLILADPDRLARLLGDPKRPVVLIFAGKAHPNDGHGQDLIRMIHHYSREKRFQGRILLLEGYDMALARKLISGVDVWLNTPEYPLEASGTSGQKAGINGGINLSVLDGWWGEGYNGKNGWAIMPHDSKLDLGFRNHEESNELLNLLEYEVIPTYYTRINGYPERWVELSKAAMKSIIPHFNAQRAVMDYIRGYYAPAARQWRRLAQDHAAAAGELAQWKKRVRAAWPGVILTRIDTPKEAITAGTTLPIQIQVTLNGLSASDLMVECVLGTQDENSEFTVHERAALEAESSTNDKGHARFTAELKPSLPGLQCYHLRAYPFHSLLSHPYEMGLLKWL